MSDAGNCCRAEARNAPPHPRSVLGFQHGDEGFLGDADFAELFHALFALFLFFEEFALAGDVAAVAFGGDVLAEGADGRARDDLGPDRRLDGDGELLRRDDVHQDFADLPAARFGLAPVDDAGEGFDDFAVDEDVQTDEVFGLVARGFVVHGGVAARDALEPVVEVDEDFVERHQAREHDALGVEGFGLGEGAALVHDEFHHVADLVAHADEVDADDGFFDAVDFGGVGQEDGVVDFLEGAVAQVDAVDDAGVGGDDVAVVFAPEPLLDDFHVQEAQESAAEAEAEGDARLVLVLEGGVVEGEFFEGVFEFFVVVGVDGVEAGEDHGADGLESGKGVVGGFFRAGHGVADADFGGVLDVGHDVADLPGAEFGAGAEFGVEDADFLDFVVAPGAEQADAVAAPEGAVEDAQVDDAAAEGVVFAVEDEGAGLAGVFGLGRRDALDEGFQDVGDAGAGLGADAEVFFGGDGEDVFDLARDGVGVGGGHVGLVEDRDHADVVGGRQEGVRDGLRLHALGGIDDEQGAFARGEGAGDFVGEVDVPGGVDEVEFVGLPVARGVGHGDGVGLDGDAALALEVHVVEQLVALVALGDGAGQLEEAVGKGGLAVVDVRDDAEVADQREVARRRRRGREITELVFGRMTSGVANDAPETRNTQHKKC